MSKNKQRLYFFDFVAKSIEFSPNYIYSGNIALDIQFLNYDDKRIFNRTVQHSSNPLQLNEGRSFMFALNRKLASVVAEKFIIQATLQKFDHVADISIFIRLYTLGPNVVNEFALDGNAGKQFSFVTTNCKNCPNIPDAQLKNIPSYKGNKNDDEDWKIVCAELNGQTIAIKYRKSQYNLETGIPQEQCKNKLAPESTRSEEKLNTYFLSLMEEMHNIATMTALTTSTTPLASSEESIQTVSKYRKSQSHPNSNTDIKINAKKKNKISIT
ncbi:uncharacterized protein LOC126898092 [Daktulosphaira vitifoliae]|uniref:uncharacterized protein LOC126898092 n=1 Tax=Daktulosphaira vitifoliae TaxID=58002 RepID=UPI0021A987FE|nr:uncharacterized protein LOC126898092 [Daktulosphaira vitifoliae]